MSESRPALGPLGRRLLVAFVVVALSSLVVLTIAALVGTSAGLASAEETRRESAAAATATAAAGAYQQAGSWATADLAPAFAQASSAGAGLVVFDPSGAVVSSAGGGSGMGQMMGQMLGNGRGGVNAPVVVDGVAVGSIRLGFGSPTTGTAQTIAWRWILIAALAALVIAVLMALYVSRRISDPLVRLTGLTRAFAAGDRTARASAEDTAAPGELGELARAFDATADDVARSEAARRRMAADIAHELRTPLAALQAGLEEVRDGLVPADPDRIAALHAQSVRLGRVIADLSSLSAAQTATLTLRRELVDLGDLVEDAVSAARPAFVAADVALDAQATHGVVVSADADRVHQAIGNLLTNAVHYCRAGDLVTLTVTAEGHFGVVTVADTGPGIPLGDQPHVFDRLWRGTADTQTAGSGIGLAVVRELVAAHGGRVSVESDGVSGATFEVRLPIAVGSATPGVR